MEHIEEAGIHSGDSACALPPITLGGDDVARIRAATEAIARGVGVRGLLNVQYALAGGVLYVLEANPRATRTVPFVSKATAVPLAKAAARVMLGASIAELRAEGLLPADGRRRRRCRSTRRSRSRRRCCRSTGSAGHVDTVLGPEMRSTGEVMGIDAVLRHRLREVPDGGVRRAADQGPGVRVRGEPRQASHDPPGEGLADLGFEILATEGTAEVLRRNGVHAKIVRKHSDGPVPTASRRSWSASSPVRST